ncbi:MAG: hypothetical protein A2W91_04545 [Bacteroidetes bacterium GWF2_38_335]|nr:MAG: hypothetical protein A2W91_04545 [Bacteroidetes bacterium GWF2_38_335]HBS88223.1 hypothetical protein [Bacteroidales bacterium]
MDTLDGILIDSKRELKIFRPTPLLIWSILVIIAFLFKTMHWPFGNMMIIFYTAGFSAYIVNGFIWLKKKNFIGWVLMALAVFWFCKLVYGAVFSGGYPFNYKALGLYVAVFLCLYAFYELLKRHQRRRLKIL